MLNNRLLIYLKKRNVNNFLIQISNKYSTKSIGKPNLISTLKSNETNLQDFLFDKEWCKLLSDEFTKQYFINLNKYLKNAYVNQVIYPKKEEIFRVLNLIKLNQIKVVIIGQDPYHNGQANGLAFSVQASATKLPPSLKNMFVELKNDIPETQLDKGGCLDKWTEQGVFLLNTLLTVEAQKPASHANLGWHLFTDKIIKIISEERDHCVFLLWGQVAQKKEELINPIRHKIIKCAHPSPFSVKNFFNSKCFSRANDYLVSVGNTPVDWSLKE